jgi:hypothetical protein
MKRPSFQFYPSDWLRDTALRSCSTGARGLWIDMICYMHEGNPYGHLKVGDKVILAHNLARMVGETLDVVEGWLNELKLAGVYDLTTDGVIFSRRMIRDENLRNIRALGGKLGGNPALKEGHKVNLKVVPKDKQKPTPSSSSSSSSINNTIDRFDEFWKAYPRKVSKGAAEKAWNKIKPNDETVALMIKAISAQKLSEVEEKFIPYPASWLNATKWLDEVKSTQKPIMGWK